MLLATTLERGFAAGARIALAPLVTDLPIVALSVLVLQGLPGEVLAAFSLAGAAFVAYLAFDAARARDRAPTSPRGDLRRAVLVNILSPHPWLFWITVGAPLLVHAARDSIASAAGFVVAFYALLVGAKLAIAGLVAAGRRGAWQRFVRPLSVLLLAAAAVALALDGLSRL